YKTNARGILAGSLAAGVAWNKSVKLTLSSAHLTESESRRVIVKRCHNPSDELCGKLDTLVSVRALQFFFCATGVSFFLVTSLHGNLSNGQRYTLNFVDIEGHKFSTADGHVTVL